MVQEEFVLFVLFLNKTALNVKQKNPKIIMMIMITVILIIKSLPK